MPSPWHLLTWRGRLLLLAGLVLTAVAVGYGQRDLLWLGLAILLLPAVAAFLVGTSQLGLRVHREMQPAQAPVGSPMVGNLTIDKNRNLSGGLLLFEEHLPSELGTSPRFTLHQVAGHTHREFSYDIDSTQRGRYVAGPLRVETRDPFGLVRLLRSQVVGKEVLVTPVVHPLTERNWRSSGDSAGEASPQRLGLVGEDDVLLREYRHGDDLRRVHWRSSAKRGSLMVRREEQAWDPTALVLIDSRMSSLVGDGPASSFEWIASAGASVALHFLRRGYRVDVGDAAGRSLQARPGNEAAASEQEILEFTTDLQPFERITIDELIRTGREATRGQTIFAIMGGLNALEAQRLLDLGGPHGKGAALVVDVNAWPGKAASTRTTQGLEEGIARLQAAGWRTVRVTPSMTVPEAWTRLLEEGL